MSRSHSGGVGPGMAGDDGGDSGRGCGSCGCRGIRNGRARGEDDNYDQGLGGRGQLMLLWSVK